MNDHPQRGPVDESWRTDLTRAWAAEIAKTVFIPMSHAKIVRLLGRMTATLADAVVAEPPDPAGVAEIGPALVNRAISGKATLATTLDVLGRGLLAMPNPPPELPARVVAVLSVLAAGYAEALRERTYISQEALKRSLIKAKRDTERSLADSDARLRAIFSSSAVGIAISTPTGKFAQTNAALTEILGYGQPELAGMSVQDLAHADAAGWLAESIADLLAGRRPNFRERCRLVHQDGESVWAYLAVSLLRDDHDQPAYLVTMVEDVTELHLLGDRLGHQSLHDMLTGLPNRQYFVSTLERALGGSPANGRITLFHFGLDRFTVVNDGLGQHVGDQLLRAVAQRLESVFQGETAMVARLGGDEFAVLLEGTADTPGVGEYAARVLDTLAVPMFVGGDGIAVSTCMGIVDRIGTGQDPAELLRAADMTLHRAKRRGAGQWDLFDARQDAADRSRFRLAATLPGALQADQLDVVYQRLLRFSDETTIGVTARLAWRPPAQQPMRHSEVLALAEETGVVLPVGRWVIRRACQQAAEWWKAHGPATPPLVVDLSAGQARDPDLVGVVRRELDAVELPAEQLRLGVSLGSAAQNDEIIDNILVLAEMGVTSSLLDYGTEHADLLLRGEFTLRAVVLDPRLGDSLAEERAAEITEPVVRSLVDFAHSLGLPVAVGGIRHEEHLRRLRAVGVDAGQGEPLSPSVSADRITLG
ncbi:putative bifunctional diguanylate cyclase/phosphodiesterase [Kutzneria sp. NPDC052558]|uniref:putative bifunctional diguanylate cyclase/phosphodiesterase n=1 Tax=Kutzneria sp. NPDC052558 TaxID=3364121 RepID=UPI0037C8689E